MKVETGLIFELFVVNEVQKEECDLNDIVVRDEGNYLVSYE